MLCDICHKNNASVHLTEIVNDKIAEMHICKSCAKLKAEQINEPVNFSDFLGSLAGKQGLPAGRQGAPQLKCPSCGLTFVEFQKKGRMGCAKCYEVFKTQVLPLLKRIQRSIRHTGKIPFKLKKKPEISRDNLEQLNQRLKEEIKREAYEEAAKTRDQIKRLDKK